MSDTTEAAVRRLRQEVPKADAVFKRLEAEVEPSRAQLIAEFAGIFLSKAPPDFLRERSVDVLVQIVLGAFRFLESARADRVDVQVLNPHADHEGWEGPVTVIRTKVSERPFIVDTIRELLRTEDLAIEHIVYPVLHVERDMAGKILEVKPSREGSQRESLVHCEVAQVTDPAAMARLGKELERRLEDVVRATDDFGAMSDAVDDVVAELAERGQSLVDRRAEMRETQAFLRWLRDGGFVFLGYRGYDIIDTEGQGPSIRVEAGSGRGILRNEAGSTFAVPVPLSSLDPWTREIVERGPLLIISKTNAEATVHRRARMDYIGVKKLDEGGEVTGEHRFLGLFTSRAYAEDAEKIPILRLKLRRILDESGVREGSHDYKEIITIFNSLPKEEVFLTSAENIGAEIRTILNSYNTAEVKVTMREDPLRRGASVMVIVPKDRFSGEVRKAVEAELVRAFEGKILNYHLTLGEGDQARLHFYLAAKPDRLAAVGTVDMESVVSDLIRSWPDRVRDGLEEVRPPEEARRLARRYGEEFSPEYQAATAPDVAVQDILEIEAMQAEDRLVSVGFANRGTAIAAPGVDAVTELKVYLRGERLILSDFMPILENLGFRVIAVAPFDVGAGATPRAGIYAFAVQVEGGRPLDIEGRGALIAETILSVRAGDARNDPLNRLVLGAGLHWREVDVLRAYAAYAFQAGAVPSRAALPSALVRHPGLARELFDFFQVRFDPAPGVSVQDRRESAADVRAAFQASLRGVAALADDRALRRLESLIAGTVRTNFYARGGRAPNVRSGGAPYISFKLDCREVDFLRQSRLRSEVWVHSSRMEGVHLRATKVARGGIRWSDRPDDFRTEIMGLVRTQIVKNAVIVPSGSKGGFITRLHPETWEARVAEGRDQYRTLIRGLLDLTDNIDASSGKSVSPKDVVLWDEPDPYLVVAADKGTAKFSDVANEVAAEYGFWLGDAFASGGSRGYDHKAVGITARGAWECVKRHFREKGKNIQEAPFTVVGIGDMSGDVFGNGMLLSRQIRLIAAFDHRHSFIDPDPDPARTFAERQRLFVLGSSSWADYDATVLSEGGMIVPRGAKEVELTPQARVALGLSVDAPKVMDGESLIRALLCAPVELLWNGGIGTYVKATSESHADAGDPTNDAVRVNASDLRCEVVGEGGNLGLTQAARVEFAMRRGRLNTDAIDNSGGVDMSDHEVNLKILLVPAVADNRMKVELRNQLLATLTESVAELVLADNRSQSLAISLDELRANESTDDFRDLMLGLERTGDLDRAAEGLPTTDVIAERRELGRTVVRPELCVLLAHVKLALKMRLLRGALPDDPVTESYLLGYFPPESVRPAGHDGLAGHRLRREIIAGQLTNDLVDLMGATFVHRVAADTGRSDEEVVRAWLVASRLAGHRAMLAEVTRQQDRIDYPSAYRWLLGLARVLERTTRWVLQNSDPRTSPTAVIADYSDGLAKLRGGFGDLVAGAERALFEARVAELCQMGADEGFARNLITLRFLDQLLEILEIARTCQGEVTAAGLAYYKVSEMLDIPWLRSAGFGSAGSGRWEQRAARALSEDLSRIHRQLVVTVMGRSNRKDVAGTAIELFRAGNRDVDRFRGLVSELRGEGETSLAGVSVAVRELSTLAERIA